MDSATEEKLLAQSLLLAAAKHDVNAVKNLLPSTSANVQDAETGFAPLHAAISTCISGQPEDEEATAKIVELLLQNGAIWNDLDTNNETPGCIAHRLGLKTVYQQMVEAGVRAELLLEKLVDIQSQTSEDDDEDDEMEDEQTATETNGQPAEQTTAIDAGAIVTETEQTTSAGAPLPGDSTTTTDPPEDYIDYWDSNEKFLQSSLRFTNTQLLDSSSNAVMMDWETEIMQRHAELLLPKPGLRAMNIGHGMGIVDTAIQSHAPAEHHIVEAHPAVLKQMRANGWDKKPGVFIHEGRWQDVLPGLIEKGVVLDAIYYDTFAEDYCALKELFTESVIGLLDQNGLFGFYNGLGADRQVCYDVYTQVSELDLLDAGLETQWEELKVPVVEWEGVRRPYWNIDIYRLPTCKFIG